MTAILLDGRSVARMRRVALRERIIRLHAEHGLVPCLAVVQVAGDPAADAYVRSIRKQCENASMVFLLKHLPADTSQATLNQTLARLSADPMVQGILLQLPLPDHLDLHHALLHLDFHKDVDGIHPTNAGCSRRAGQPWPRVPRRAVWRCCTTTIFRLRASTWRW